MSDTPVRTQTVEQLTGQLTELVEYLRQASREEDVKPRDPSSFIQGMNKGYEAGYRLSANWIEDILGAERSI